MRSDSSDCCEKTVSFITSPRITSVGAMHLLPYKSCYFDAEATQLSLLFTLPKATHTSTIVASGDMHSALNKLIHTSLNSVRASRWQEKLPCCKHRLDPRHILVQAPTLEQLLSLSCHSSRFKFTDKSAADSPIPHSMHSIGQADIQFCLGPRIGIRNTGPYAATIIDALSRHGILSIAGQ